MEHTDFEKETGEYAAKEDGGDNSAHNTDGCKPKPLHQYKTQHATALRSERHANSQLTSP